MKQCSKCKELKPIEKFGKDKRNRDGLRSQCKDCKRLYNRRYEENHRDERNEKRRQIGKLYRLTHRDVEKTRLQNWKDSNPEKVKARKTFDRARRRSRSSVGDRDITLEKLFDRASGVCSLCGKKCDHMDYELSNGVFIAGDNYPSIDHIKPLSKGGSHTWDNVQLAHRKCNSIKRDREA